MTAIFRQNGNALDYRPETDIPAGAVVVQGDLVGITKCAIGAGELGAIAVSGVFDFTKATGTGTGISAGEKVYWDETAAALATTASGNKYIGKAITSAGVDDETVRIRLSQ